mmetsp:Transcript_6062/g.9285  ORF Transcript_6062/g.9285 Transcript_6062/m.9285 type:complete len:215 (-) Transcript_6062:69-713(-)|eukprot:CAMPEP_0178901738 /NCGR_PEP_ID=MMETSP0786-20121207/4206_1 /TAXON_ID=186022 /ORGANISM="Thalassionema frauenfeldii, Strain CCMP 1798" /LENGTH=214 /DNA_ID=CAMNT_0020572907 /DNA_START=252 /DNA_END=896 /DNA_ORIENTATION=-
MSFEAFPCRRTGKHGELANRLESSDASLKNSSFAQRNAQKNTNKKRKCNNFSPLKPRPAASEKSSSRRSTMDYSSEKQDRMIRSLRRSSVDWPKTSRSAEIRELTPFDAAFFDQGGPNLNLIEEYYQKHTSSFQELTSDNDSSVESISSAESSAQSEPITSKQLYSRESTSESSMKMEPEYSNRKAPSITREDYRGSVIPLQSLNRSSSGNAAA